MTNSKFLIQLSEVIASLEVIEVNEVNDITLFLIHDAFVALNSLTVGVEHNGCGLYLRPHFVGCCIAIVAHVV